jgi:CheY-like chemotaxis protein
VVEDNQDDVDLLLIASRNAPNSIRFSCVGDGEAAVAYLQGMGQFGDRQEHPFPDLVLLDISLPGMNGLEVLKWIRSRPELSELPVFVWTDSGDRETLERATAAGASRFVPKSVSFVRGGLVGLVRGISEATLAPAKQIRNSITG